MNLSSKDFYVTWRRPMIWVVLAILSFIAAWLFWQMLDRYTLKQLSYQALPNPPSITEALWVPYILTLAKLLMLLTAMTAGLSFAQERGQKTLWYLLINCPSHVAVVWAKLRAQWPVFVWTWLMLTCVAVLLIVGGTVNLLLLLTGTIGLTLLVMWLIALGQLVSAYCQSTGTAVLFNLLIYVLLWLLGGDMLDAEYGLNWLSLISPLHHLQWFCTGEVGLSSMLYFIGGTGLFIGLTALQLRRLKKML